MNRWTGRTRGIVLVAAVACLWTSAFGRAQYPVASAYEDTVRILVLYNLGATGTTVCPNNPAVGTQTMQFVAAAIDSTQVPNLKIATAHNATVTSVQGAFGSKLPHVLVHVNAGWGSTSGNNIKAILQWALDHNVGVVEVGDDDMLNLAPEFPWTYVVDMWSPMVTAGWLDKTDDRLYVVMDADLDTWSDSAAYPNLSGVIRNARRIAGSDTIQFKPVGATGRCEADPDVIGCGAGDQTKVNFLAYQEGYNAVYDSATPGLQGSGDAAPQGVVGGPDYCVVTLLQDSLELVNGWALRRAASLSMQPQFLANEAAAQQIVYDAIMYASLVHMENPPTPFTGVRQRMLRRQADLGARVAPLAAVRVTDTGGRIVYQGRADSAGRIDLGSARLRGGVYVMDAGSAGSVRFSVVR